MTRYIHTHTHTWMDTARAHCMNSLVLLPCTHQEWSQGLGVGVLSAQDAVQVSVQAGLLANVTQRRKQTQFIHDSLGSPTRTVNKQTNACLGVQHDGRSSVCGDDAGAPRALRIPGPRQGLLQRLCVYVRGMSMPAAIQTH